MGGDFFCVNQRTKKLRACTNFDTWTLHFKAVVIILLK